MRPSFTNSSQPLLLIFPKPGSHLAGRRRLNRRHPMKYKLNVSYDCGISYNVEKESEDLKGLKKRGKELDEQMLRWDIENEKGEQIECCAIHKEIITFMAVANLKEHLKREKNIDEKEAS